MYIDKLYLQDFRQFTQETWDLGPGIILIVAPNGSGKTTILEAIHLLATAQSFRAGKTAEMIRFGQEIGRVYALTDEGIRLGITLTGGMVAGQKAPIKLYNIDKTKKLQRDFVGNLLTVTFRPEDLLLIEGASSRRRTYMDGPLELTSEIYREARKSYGAALLRRNKTLKAIKEEGLSIETLHFWDKQLLEYGMIVNNYRQQYVDYINEKVHFTRPYTLIYNSSQVTEEKLVEHQAAEIASGRTFVGPHKDELRVETNLGGEVADLAVYGSRGQQRLGVLWLKLAELQYLQDKTGRVPVLLLDDIFSELDEEARALVLEVVKKQATIITALDDNIQQVIGDNIKVLYL